MWNELEESVHRHISSMHHWNVYISDWEWFIWQTGNTLEKALKKIGREDIVTKCIANVELVTDDLEKAIAKVRLDQGGFDTFCEELGPSRDASLRRNASLDVSYDEQDILKVCQVLILYLSLFPFPGCENV